MAEHGDTVAGKKIELIVKDDAATADNTKRLAKVIIVRDKVNLLAGFSVTPTAFAVAPLSTEANSDDPHLCGNIGHHRALALYREDQLHAAAVLDHHLRWVLKNPDRALRRKRGRGRTPSPAPCADSVVRS